MDIETNILDLDAIDPYIGRSALAETLEAIHYEEAPAGKKGMGEQIVNALERNMKGSQGNTFQPKYLFPNIPVPQGIDWITRIKTEDGVEEVFFHRDYLLYAGSEYESFFRLGEKSGSLIMKALSLPDSTHDE